MAENLATVPDLSVGQDVILPVERPLKATGHINILRGNLAPGGAVAKITGGAGRITGGAAKITGAGAGGGGGLTPPRTAICIPLPTHPELPACLLPCRQGGHAVPWSCPVL